MDLIVASNNAHKIEEIKNILSPWFQNIVSMGEKNIDVEVVEDGKTFEENALKKAREIQALLPDCFVMADDSGLEVDALNGAPGVYSARFAGEGHDDEANNDKLLDLLKNVPEEKRKARFVCAVAFCGPDVDPFVLRGTCEGSIAYERRGREGFGYDPLFIVEGNGKTFGELSEEEKAKLSHRGRALLLLRDELRMRKIQLDLL